MKTFVLILVFSLISGIVGCSTAGRIKTKTAEIIGVPDAGKPATLSSDTSTASLPIPAGSKLVVSKYEATATEPAREVTQIELFKPTEWKKIETRLSADTGTVDTSIARHRIDVAENRYLLWAALGSTVGAGLFLYLKYPTPAFICGGAAVVFFLAWKLSDLPDWFYVIGIAGLVGAFMLWRGHERGEAHAAETSKPIT